MSNCTLCGKRVTLQHILSGCSKALKDGWYQWWYGQVLVAIEDAIIKAIQTCKFRAGFKEKLMFYKDWRKGNKSREEYPNMLSTVADWKFIHGSVKTTNISKSYSRQHFDQT